MQSLGSRIRRLRKSKNYTGLELSKILNVAVPTISMWESNNRKPSSDMLQELSRLFNVSVDYLLTGEEPTSTKDGYYSDPEAAEYAEYLRTRPEAKILFSASKDMTKEDMEEVVNYIQYLKSKHNSNE